jgi:hypothetical protein
LRLLACKEGTPYPNASRGEEHRNEEDCFAEVGVRDVDLVVCGDLLGPLGTTVPHPHIVELGFKRFYGAVGNFQILVEAVALGNKLKGRSGGIRN